MGMMSTILLIFCAFAFGGIYSKSYRFSDINFDIADGPEKEGIIREMRALAKGCTPGEMSQITIVNRHINRELLERLQYTSAGDGLDGLRGEMNEILETRPGGAPALSRSGTLLRPSASPPA